MYVYAFLGFDLEYSSLHSRQGLRRLDELFFDYLSHVNAKVYQRFNPI